MGEAKVKLSDKKSAKKQAAEIMDKLNAHGLPIKRARMRVIIHHKNQEQSFFIQELLAKRFEGEYVIEKLDSQQNRIHAQFEPHLHRDISDVFSGKSDENDKIMEGCFIEVTEAAIKVKSAIEGEFFKPQEEFKASELARDTADEDKPVNWEYMDFDPDEYIDYLEF
jgi:hypothetical protein